MTERRIQSLGYIMCYNELPETRGLLCYNYNNSVNAIQGAQNKQLGLQPFRADLTLYWNSTATFIEVKTDGGYQSKGQKEWQALVEGQGFKYVVTKTPQEIFEEVKRSVRAATRTPKYY